MKRVLMLAGVLFLLSQAMISCKSGNNQTLDKSLSTDLVKNPITASGDGDSTDFPVFQFAEDVHDFGKIIQGEKVSYSFKFKNVGKSDLIISDAHGSCGCAIADYPKTAIAPGGESTIDVTFNTEGKKGFQNKNITLVANTHPNNKVLYIKAMVQIPEGEN